MARYPLAQGELDGLCGMYSIVNAYRYLLKNALDREDADELFRITLESTPQRRYPDVILEGTSFSDLRLMAIVAKNWANERLADSTYRVRLRCPFQGKALRKMEKFWKAFDAELEDDVYGAAILSLREPDPHWVCAYKIESSRIHFYNSSGEEYRKNRSSTGLGPISGPNRFRLNYTETVIIRVDEMASAP